MLRPGPVEAAFTGRTFNFEHLSRGIDRLKDLIFPRTAPTFGRCQNPFDLMVSTDFYNGRLIAYRENDRIVCRIVINGIDVRPVAARTNACDIAESIGFIHGRKICCGKRLSFFGKVNIETHRTLVHCFDDIVAITIENFPKTPIINNIAGLIDLNDNVAYRPHRLAVWPRVGCSSDAQEIISIFRSTECM